MRERAERSKLLKDASVGDYIESQKLARWNAGLSQALMLEFLDVRESGGTVELLLNLNDTLSNYEKHIICAVLGEYVEKNGYKVVRSFSDHDSDDIYPCQFENLEIGPKQFMEVVEDGTLFLANVSGKSEQNICLKFEYYSPTSYKLRLYACKNHRAKAEEFFTGLKAYAKANNYLKNKKITPDYAFIEVNTQYTWDSIILDPKTKGRIRREIEVLLSNVEIYELNNIPFKRGLILKGVPGVGKTLIGKVLCNMFGCTVLWVTPKYLERSSNVAAIGELARELAPTILFLEDIDLYGADRDSSSHKTLLGELMNQLDGIAENKNIVVVATTNRGDDLEKALRNRPGRFDSVIELKPPAVAEREEMLRHYVGRFKQEDIDFAKLAKETDGYTGAHIKDLVDLAVMAAIEDGSLDSEKKIILKNKHLSKNIKKVKGHKIPIGFSTVKEDRGADDEVSVYPND